MIFDAERLPADGFTERAFDVCVIGSGAGGLALARKLAAPAERVASMEGGGTEISRDSEKLDECENVGADYWPLTAVRRRYFGGSSKCRSDVSRQLDAHDFTPRAHDPWSGRPIGKRDLDAHLRRERGKPRPAGQAGLELYRHADPVDLELDHRLQRVTAGVFRGFWRPAPFPVTANVLTLCLDGLENPRLLLNADR